MIFTEILAKIDRAAVAGTRVTLDVKHVQALLASPAYATICELKAREIAALWQAEEKPEPVPADESNSARSGCGIAPTVMTGASAGTMTAAERESVGHAASRRASAAVAMVRHHKKRKTRS